MATTLVIIGAAVALAAVAIAIRMWRASEEARRILEEDERGCE